MTSIITDPMRQAKLNYNANIKKIQTYPMLHDKLKKCGKIWINRGYNRTFVLDRSYPFVLQLKFGPHETEICPQINFFLEEVEEKIKIYPAENTEPTKTSLRISILDDPKKESWYSFARFVFVFPNKKTCEIIETKKVETYTSTKRTLVCS